MNNKTKTPSSKLRLSLVLLPVICAVSASLIIALIISSHRSKNVMIGNERYSIQLTDIDLKDRGISDTDILKRFSDAKFIDLRDNPLSFSDIDSLSIALPKCEILWSVPFCGSYVSSDISNITLNAFQLSEYNALRYFTKLSLIDARGLDYETVSRLNADFPKCTILWDIAIGDNRYSPSEKSITTGNASKEDILNLLLFDSLESVNAVGCTAYDELMYVSAQMPSCDFLWNADIGGITVSSKDTHLNFKRTVISDIQALDKDFEKLEYLPSLTSIDMCGCGVSNEQMAVWRDRYPQCKFIWEITVGTSRRNWTVRTDIQVFSTLLYDKIKLGDENTYKDLFLYCTDLTALDLGHNYIEDISMISNLKKLQGLILTDNPVSDITPLSQLPELVYLELMKTDVKDLTPLQNCKKLTTLNVSNSKVKDLTPILGCSSLKNVQVVYNAIGSVQAATFKKALPEAVLYYRKKELPAENDAVTAAFKEAFLNYKKIESFESWESFRYKQ